MYGCRWIRLVAIRTRIVLAGSWELGTPRGISAYACLLTAGLPPVDISRAPVGLSRRRPLCLPEAAGHRPIEAAMASLQ